MTSYLLKPTPERVDPLEKRTKVILTELPPQEVYHFFFFCMFIAASKLKMYACDVDICDTEESPICKPLEEAATNLLDMEGMCSMPQYP